MRIIHTSDWHLGQYFYGKSRANEHQEFLTWLLAQAKSHDVDAIIVAGDIFDTATPPSYARQMYFNFISELQSLNCQLVILAGNHDSVSMLAESKDLLSALSTRVIANVSDLDNNENLAEQVFILKNNKQKPKAVICAVPFIRPRDVIKSQQGQSASDKSLSLQQAIVAHYQALFEYAQQLVKDSKLKLPIIATGHLTALGVTTSDSVRDIYIGTLEALPSNAFPAADYIALGHIHRAQKVGKTENIRYCGSPIALSFDEAKQNKRVLLVDFNEGDLSSVTDLIVPCFQPLAMVKTSLHELSQVVEKLLAELNLSPEDNPKLWLDIELVDSDRLSDLQSRIETLVEDFPVEILLVRRAKQIRQQLMQEQQDNSMLSELTLDDVFSSRLSQEEYFNQKCGTTNQVDSNEGDSNESHPEVDIEAEKVEDHKKRLQTLFKQTVAQVLAKGSAR
ncbi:exonuclease subunit SbcD [Candidatus Colwellia aromaticivorans]|uniref:exonuclease subunit SbcD n=1 Tax=Candidatus Colwellia aromaticivorans TaxID=2267621 RepID=UPI000DF32AC6|nr:exonuclease subunit SbcD [Candidatus Colwellia aromaticivorans]